MSSDTGGVNVLPTCIAVLSLSAIMLCLCIVAALMRQLPLRPDDFGSLSFIFAFGGSGNSRAAPSGLDPAAIQRLPMTVIAAKTESESESGSSSSSEECSVCISELRDGDKARMLPPCGHTFHVECIDSWLLSCATCPLCRNAVVVPSAPVPAPPVSVIASTSADAAAVDLTRAPTAVPGPADVAIHIDADFAAAAFREGDETVPPNTRARLVHLFTVSSAVPTCFPSI